MKQPKTTAQTRQTKAIDLSRRTVRLGWTEAFARMTAAKDDPWVYGSGQTETKFDATEWHWSGPLQQHGKDRR